MQQPLAARAACGCFARHRAPACPAIIYGGVPCHCLHGRCWPPSHSSHLPLSCWQLRARVWPVLLGVESALAGEAATFAARAAAGHKDSHVVACDMERSLWSFTEGALCLLH